MGQGESETGKIHIDSDWKSEAAKEKEILAEKESKERQAAPPPGADAPANLLDIINILAMQAMIALGGYQGPGGERIPPNPMAARHHIDLLEVLDKKTQGNQSPEEKEVLTSVLYELRMTFVQVMNAAGRPPAPKA